MATKHKELEKPAYMRTRKGAFWSRFLIGAIAVFVIWFFVIRPNSNEVPPQAQQQLLEYARNQLAATLGGDGLIDVDLTSIDESLLRNRAAFVSLKIDGVLQGCMIDQFDPHEPLIFNVLRNTELAAGGDARFETLDINLLERVQIMISVLNELRTVESQSPDGLIDKLSPSVHGVVLDVDDQLASYLPSIWSLFPEPEEFLSQLCIKAGWPADRWQTAPYPVVQTYRVFEFGESSH